MIEFAKELLEENTNLIIVYVDVNSTMIRNIVASKFG